MVTRARRVKPGTLASGPRGWSIPPMASSTGLVGRDVGRDRDEGFNRRVAVP
jgi:hypothetical protein